MGVKHKHADCIIAWANGKDVQVMDSRGVFVPVATYPSWHEHMEYRIKPEPKPDVVKYMGFNLRCDDDSVMCNHKQSISHWKFKLMLTFDGDSEVLKSAEVIS